MKLSSIITFGLTIAFASVANAAFVQLVNYAATYSQTSADLEVDETIDGILSGLNGWAIETTNASQTAVWETQNNVGGPGGALFTFTLYNQYQDQYTLGKFRLSVTTDDRSTFADNVVTGGDVNATWIELAPLSAVDAGSGTEIFTINGDNSITVSGPNPATATYIVTASTTVTGITGIRLEAIKDGSGTPGRTLQGNALPNETGNGNFVLNEIVVDAVALVPEPSSVLLAFIGMSVVMRRYRR
jgi:hypothetical protein